MVKTELQIRVDAPTDGEDISKFECQGKSYEIKGISEKRHLIPRQVPNASIITGYQRQYVAVEQGSTTTVEVYVYYYKAYEGKKWAVIDTIEFQF